MLVRFAAPGLGGSAGRRGGVCPRAAERMAFPHDPASPHGQTASSTVANIGIVSLVATDADADIVRGFALCYRRLLLRPAPALVETFVSRREGHGQKRNLVVSPPPCSCLFSILPFGAALSVRKPRGSTQCASPLVSTRSEPCVRFATGWSNRRRRRSASGSSWRLSTRRTSARPGGWRGSCGSSWPLARRRRRGRQPKQGEFVFGLTE